MKNVKFDLKNVICNYLSADLVFCIEIDGVKKTVSGLEAHTVLHKLLDGMMYSNGFEYEMEDGRIAKVSLVDYDVDAEITIYEEEETA